MPTLTIAVPQQLTVPYPGAMAGWGLAVMYLVTGLAVAVMALTAEHRYADDPVYDPGITLVFFTLMAGGWPLFVNHAIQEAFKLDETSADTEDDGEEGEEEEE